MSYFAKPNFIIYDEWFAEDSEKTKLDTQNVRKIETSTNLHEFFYSKSSYKVGASENNIELNLEENKKERITSRYITNKSKKLNLLSKKQLSLFELKNFKKIKFSFKKKLIYSLSIFFSIFIFGFTIFFVSQSTKSEPEIKNKLFNLEQNF